MSKFLDKLNKALEESTENALSVHARSKLYPPSEVPDSPDLGESSQSTKGSSQVSRAPAFGSAGSDSPKKKKSHKKISTNNEAEDSDNT